MRNRTLIHICLPRYSLSIYCLYCSVLLSILSFFVHLVLPHYWLLRVQIRVKGPRPTRPKNKKRRPGLLRAPFEPPIISSCFDPLRFAPKTTGFCSPMIKSIFQSTRQGFPRRDIIIRWVALTMLILLYHVFLENQEKFFVLFHFVALFTAS